MTTAGEFEKKALGDGRTGGFKDSGTINVSLVS
jgi:hypothetical protein